MKLGLFMMPLHPPGRLHAETYDEDLETVVLADRLGYSEAWIGEHFLLPWENMPAPELFIARAIGETENIVLGTGVVLLALHNPVLEAHRLAMLDHLAKGRFYFGIGAGGGPIDFETFVIDGDLGGPRERMTECVELIVRLWEEGPFEHQGRFYNVGIPEDRTEMELGFHMKPYQKPHPPIAVAGASVRSETLELAGEKGWWPLSGGLVHASAIKNNWESVLTGAAKTGKEPSRRDWRIARDIFIADSSQEARDMALNGTLARDFVEYWKRLIGNGPRGLDTFKYDPSIPDEALTPEYMLEHYWIVGDPEECTQKIRDLYRDSGGFGTLLIQTTDWGRDNDKWHRCLELLATEVLPGLQDLSP